MDLAIFPKRKLQVFAVVKSLASHDCSGTDSGGKPTFDGELVEETGCDEDKMDGHQAWNMSEGEAMPYGTAPLFDDTYATFYFRNVLVSAGEIDSWSMRHLVQESLNSVKLSISVDRGDLEATL